MRCWRRLWFVALSGINNRYIECGSGVAKRRFNVTLPIARKPPLVRASSQPSVEDGGRNNGTIHDVMRNRSHSSEQRRCGFAGKVSLHGGGKVFEAVAGLSVAGLHYGENCLDESATFGALGTKRQLSPYNCGSQRPFAGIIGRLNLFYVHKRP